MCGIVGYVGPADDDVALTVVLEGLRRLEYRGYDSAGIAIVADEGLVTEKRAGKLVNLTDALGRLLAAAGPYGDRPHPLGHARRRRPTPTPTRTGAARTASWP